MAKKFKIAPEDIKDIATGHGYGYVSDLVTVEGQPIRVMYRETREEKDDSGWRFLSGNETDDYVDDEHNLMIFDVNTIANYDPTIIPYLKAKTGSAFAKEEGSDTFVPIDMGE